MLRRLSPGAHLVSMAIFVASLVHLSGPLFAPAEVVSRAIVSSGTIWFLQHVVGRAPKQAPAAGGAIPEQPGDDLVVLEIDEATFFHPDHYGGRSPLDRCLLKQDIESILRAYSGLITLGIDFDLSPVGDVVQDQCTFQLLDLLKVKHEASPGKEFRAVLIWPVLPFEQAQARKWFDIVQSRGIRIVDPRFHVEFGMVRAYSDAPDQCPSLGVAVREAQRDDRFCHCQFESMQQKPDHGWLRQIAFETIAFSPTAMHLVDDQGYQSTLKDQIKATASSKVRRVLFGAGYTRDEVWQTPVAQLSGIEIHAAIASREGPSESGLWGFLLDVVVGVAFGALVHWIWRGYLVQRLGLRAPPKHGAAPAITGLPPRETAWRWMALLALVTVAVAALLAAFSGAASQLLSIWIRPVPVVIGMACDALVMGSVQAIIHARDHGLMTTAPATQRPLGWWDHAMAQVPAVVWLVVVGINLVLMVRH